MKRIIRIPACFLLVIFIIASFAFPAMALSSTMTHKYDSGVLKDALGKQFTYSTDTAASTTRASATLSCSRSELLYAKITATLSYADNTYINRIENATNGLNVTATTNNVHTVSGSTYVCEIMYATGTYRVGSYNEFIIRVQ